MKKLVAAAVAAITMASASSASAAIILYNVKAEPYRATWARLGPGSDAPFGMSPDEIVRGTVTIDTDKTGLDSFVDLSIKSGTKVWTVADLVDGSNTFYYRKDRLAGVALIFNEPGNRMGGNTSTRFTEGDVTYYGAQFSIQSSIPEPAAWALMILGFGLAGSAVRRASAAGQFVQA